MVDGKLMSADKPGASAPDVNHFVIGRAEFDNIALVTSDTINVSRFLPGGLRRTAADAASALRWRIKDIDLKGDCLIDCFVGSNYKVLVCVCALPQ